MRLASFFKPKPDLQPEHHLLSRVRRRLTFWYSGVLAVALIVFGTGIYLGVQQALVQPIEQALAGQAARSQQEWQQRPERGCQLPGTRFNRGDSPVTPPSQSPAPVYTACIDANGAVTAATIDAPPGAGTRLTGSTLVQTALQTGRAADTFSNSDTGEVLFRYAVRVQNTAGSGTLGVIVASRSIADIENALNILRLALLGFGSLILAGATLGGIFLANRALVPTREALVRQKAFIADASHELRTPLTLLRMNAEILLRNRARLSEDDVQLLEDIVSETEYLTRVSANLLALARLDAGSSGIEKEPVDLSEITARAVHRMHIPAEEKGVALSQKLATACVSANNLMLEQLLLIVLDNAVKYTDEGGKVQVTVCTTGQHAVLTVQDSGIGIPAEHLHHLGERFYRVDKARERATGGTGLGLSMARSIVAAHGGSFKIESVPDRGTTLTVQLPLCSTR